MFKRVAVDPALDVVPKVSPLQRGKKVQHPSASMRGGLGFGDHVDIRKGFDGAIGDLGSDLPARRSHEENGF